MARTFWITWCIFWCVTWATVGFFFLPGLNFLFAIGSIVLLLLPVGRETHAIEERHDR